MAMFDFLRHRSRKPAKQRGASAADRLGPTDDQLREGARELILPGFVRRVDAVVELAEQYALGRDDPRVARAVDAVWRERHAEQASWTGPGDFDRVRLACERLATRGVLVRMNFACCQSCGIAEIDAERTPLAGASAGTYGYREWAYTFFHRQDTERLAEMPSALYLSFGAFRPAPGLDPGLVAAARSGDPGSRRKVARQTDVAVGTIVTAELRGQGLVVDWDGQPEERIIVEITDWRKPLPM